MSLFHRPRRLGPVPSLAGAPPIPAGPVLQGDCLEVLPSLPDGCAGLVLTDPPYLVRYRDRAGRRIANDDRADWLVPAFREVHRVLDEDSVLVSFYGWQAVDQFMGAWRAAGFRPVAHLVFAKRYASRVGMTEARHESAYVLAKGRPPLPRRPLPDVLPFPYTGNRHHPTEKPVAALTPVIEAFSQPGALVLDPFCGSGSTLVAAQGCGRIPLGIELDAGHAATARMRLMGEVQAA